jgi:hypothetical protein
MTRLTDLQRRALHLASLKGGVLVTRRRTATPKTVTTRVANVLLDLGFVTRHQETLLITKEGRSALHAVLPEGPAEYLRQRDGITSRMDLRVREEDEVMRVDKLRPDWASQAEQARRLSSQEADAHRLSGLTHPEERLAELRRMAMTMNTPSGHIDSASPACPDCRGTGKDALQMAMSSAADRLEPIQDCPVCRGAGTLATSLTLDATHVDRVRQTFSRVDRAAAVGAIALRDVGKMCLLARPGDERVTLERILDLVVDVCPHDLLEALEGEMRPRGGIDMPGEGDSGPATVA